MRSAFFILFFSLTCFQVIAEAADIQHELQGVNREIREKRQLLRKTRKEERLVSNDLVKIDRTLQEKEQNLKALNRELKQAEVQVERTQQEIETARHEAQKKRDQIRQRLVSLYKAGELGSVRMFFSSGTLPQLVENQRYMKVVLEHDKVLFAEYNARIDKLRSLKLNLEQDAARKEKIKGAVNAKKQEIETEKQKKTVYLSQVRQDQQTYLASLKELQANAKRLQTMVERLEARSRKSYTAKSEKKPSRLDTGKDLPPVADKGFASQRGRLPVPVRGQVVGTYGRHKHPEFNSYTISNGISISAPAGTEIRSVYDGQVIFASAFKGYGNMVIIDHGGGYFSLYAHSSKILKGVGTKVSGNEAVALVGDTDSSKGPLLYFEIRYQGKPIDPSPWLR